MMALEVTVINPLICFKGNKLSTWHIWYANVATGLFVLSESYWNVSWLLNHYCLDDFELTLINPHIPHLF